MNAKEGLEEALLPTIWRQRWIVAATASLCVALGLVYLLVATPVYSVGARLSVHKAGPAIMSDKQDAEQGSDNYLYTQSEMLTSTPILAIALATPGTDEFKTFKGVKNRISYLKRNLEAEVGRKDDLITLNFESPYPEEAVKIVNNVVDAYVAYQASEKRDTAGEVLSILTAEKAKRDHEIAANDTALQALEKEHGAIPLDGERGNVVMQRLTSLSDALTAAQLQMLAARSALEEALKASSLTEADLSDEAIVSLGNTSEEQLRTELFVTRQRLEEVRAKYLPSHPMRQSLEARAKQLSVAAVVVVRQRLVTAQAQEQGLAKAFAEQQAAALAFKARAAQYAKLQAEQDRLRLQSDNLDNRIKEVSVAQSAGALNINVFEPALASDEPVKPAGKKLLAAALLAGLVIGAGLGVVREWTDPRVRSAEEVKGALGMSVVGSIPRITGGHSDEARGWIVHLDSLSPVAEAYRSVRTAVMYGQDTPPRTILITSPSGGEGKSTVASNLAIAMAKAGKRVLLVDCDFRSPVQHRVFGVRDDEGIAAVLASGEPIETAIHRTAVERLDVLPCGPVPRDPSEILNSESFAMTIDGLAAVYDHVLIDSPATSQYNDARIIGASCDATLLVIRAEKSNRRVVETSRDGLISVGAKILGVVLNDVKGAGNNGSSNRTFGAPSIAYAEHGDRRFAQKQLPAGETVQPLMTQLVNDCHLHDEVTELQRQKAAERSSNVLYSLSRRSMQGT